MSGREFGTRTSTGYYLAQNRWLVGGLRIVDGLLSLRRQPDPAVTERPRRLLIAIGGHLGDAVVASATLAPIRTEWPDAEIGILLGSWSARVLKGHPDIARIHTWDHWKLNRGAKSHVSRFWRHVTTRRRVIRELRTIGYDMAIDLQPYFPNAAPVLWRSGIPRRIGFSTGGAGPLYTTRVLWTDERRHLASHHRDLLHAAGIRTEEPLQYAQLPSAEPDRLIEAPIVVHMGAGLPHKEWPLERWIELVEGLVEDGYPVVLTGAGSSECRNSMRLQGAVPAVFDRCGMLDWEAFVGQIQDARIVVCVDSVAAHVAAAGSVPAVVLSTGINPPSMWTPLGSDVTTLITPVPCAPCFRSGGCETMECIMGTAVREVRTAVDGALARSRNALPMPDRSLSL